jgi:hypothetical protein
MNAPAEEILATEAQEPAVRVRIAEEEEETALATVVFPIVVAAHVVLALLVAEAPAEPVRVAAALEVHQVWVARAVGVEGVEGNPARRRKIYEIQATKLHCANFLFHLARTYMHREILLRAVRIEKIADYSCPKGAIL